jgi:hypothetical protein
MDFSPHYIMLKTISRWLKKRTSNGYSKKRCKLIRMEATPSVMMMLLICWGKARRAEVPPGARTCQRPSTNIFKPQRDTPIENRAEQRQATHPPVTGRVAQHPLTIPPTLSPPSPRSSALGRAVPSTQSGQHPRRPQLTLFLGLKSRQYHA